MCGATGEVRLDGRTPDVAAVSAMAEAMAPRGPDGAGVWSQGRVALGHRRLKIIDLSEAGAQPMVDSDLGLAIAWNGCIYNYKELAPRTVRARLPVLLDQRHRGAAEGLPPLGRPLRRPAVRDVRVRHRRAGQRPGAARPRPARHQAALHHRGCAPHPVRLVAARAGGRRWRRHPHRPGGAAPLPHVPLGGSAAADDPARRLQDPARDARRDRAGRPPHHHHLLGSRLQPTRRPPRTGPKRTGKTPFWSRCASRSTAAWWPTCRWAACCRAASTPA